MKSLVSLFFVLGHSIVLFAQTDIEKTNSIFIELAGSGGLGSLNYESVFIQKTNTAFSWRAGLSLAPIDKNNGTGIVVPLMVNVFHGKNSSKLEAGVGQGMTITTKGNFFIITTLATGYRFQPNSRKWYFRVMYTPLLSYLVDFQWQHWGGISVGYSFKSLSK